MLVTQIIMKYCLPITVWFYIISSHRNLNSRYFRREARMLPLDYSEYNKIWNNLKQNQQIAGLNKTANSYQFLNAKTGNDYLYKRVIVLDFLYYKTKNYYPFKQVMLPV
jgi:hypothetical protein